MQAIAVATPNFSEVVRQIPMRCRFTSSSFLGRVRNPLGSELTHK